jgi:hypothetical protein
MTKTSWNFAGEPQGELQQVNIEAGASIASIVRQLSIDANQILAAHAFHADSLTPTKWLVTVIRADHSLDISKVQAAAQELFGISAIRPVEAGSRWPLGFVGPDLAMRTPDAVMLVDPAAARGEIAWITGGNEAGIYVRNFNWFRECGDRLADPAKVNVAEIALR